MITVKMQENFVIVVYGDDNLLSKGNTTAGHLTPRSRNDRLF